MRCLLHTTSTHAPQEFGTVPWSTRDYLNCDILPDGAASGRIIELMRNMLVREYGSDLYLFSAVSPEWLQPGKTIEVVERADQLRPDERRSASRRRGAYGRPLASIPPAARAYRDSHPVVL